MKMLIKYSRVLVIFYTLIFSLNATAERVDIWASIPFLRGADLCAYQNAFGQTRQEYMSSMVDYASQLMWYGTGGLEAANILKDFDSLYDRHKKLATMGNYLDVTLELTLKSYLSDYYRNIRTREQKVSFRHLTSLKSVIEALKRGERPMDFDDSMMEELDYIAYGSYSYAPSCQGRVNVTLHLIGRDGRVLSYHGLGKPHLVMSQIASDIFEDFQRTTFPTTIEIGSRRLTILGDLNGEIGTVNNPTRAEHACQVIGARLPNREELEFIDLMGDFNGGVSIGNSVWAMPNGYIYHPQLMNPTPVRRVSEVNTRTFLYYCIK
ncbi:MAG: hypothetical protein HN353_13395 [Bdellovibrionales bacterium]|jgi:hypothetical protein|nr:hypothetical protein [Bdellovibrionales bacterium]MBT3524913.1 hypothetical protein [Bdellovibrionales bacterium]